MALRVDPARVNWFGPAPELCAALGADPWGVLASGCLLAGFAPAEIESATAELEAQGFEARRIAEAESGSGVRMTTGAPLPVFSRDEVARILSEA